MRAAGYTFDTDAWQLDDLVRAQGSKWETYFRDLGFSTDCREWGRSLHSMRIRPGQGDDEENAEQECWCSSKGMLAVCCFWSWFRRQGVEKERAVALMTIVLERTVTSDVLLALPWDGAEQMFQLCDKFPDYRGRCRCWGRVNSRVQAIDDSPHRATAKKLAILAKAPKDCLAVKAILGMLIKRIAIHIDERRCHWAEPDYEHNKELTLLGQSGAKRRRLDPHAIEKQLGSDSVGAGGRLPTSVSATPKDLSRHAHRVMGLHQAASHLAFRPDRQSSYVGTVAYLMDAVRFGNPGVDYNLQVLKHMKKKFISVLPPVVPRGTLRIILEFPGDPTLVR